MHYERLSREERISERGRLKDAEAVRKSVLANERNVRIGTYNGRKRLGIYRSNKKVAVLEIKDDVGDEEIRKVIKAEIAEGKFDRELVDVYRDIREKRKARRKNDAETERLP